MRSLGQLLVALGLIGLLASCVLGGALGYGGYGGAFGMLIIGLLMMIAGGKPASIDPEAPTPKTHVRCPDCRELVRADATKCKHCGTALTPTIDQGDGKAPPYNIDAGTLTARAIVFVVLLIVGLTVLSRFFGSH